MALTERLALIISGNATGAVHELDTLGAKLTGVDGLAKRTATSGSLMSKAYVGGALLAGAALVKMIKDGTSALLEQQQIDAQTKAAIASTGGIANVSAQHVATLAASIEEYSTQSQDAVKSAEAVLLSFTAVQNQMGIGNDVFDRATKSAVDLSTRFGTDLTMSTRQLGRALQDPVAGMSALSRSGVAFDAGTKAQIKSLAQQGNLLEAQKVLLDAVAKKVGGAGEAAGKTAAGGFAQLTHQLTELDKATAGPILKPLTDGLHDVVSVMTLINEHPVAEKAFTGLAEVGTFAFLASKGLRALQAIKASELATTLASSTARARNVELMNAEAVAAGKAATAVGALDVAEKTGGGLRGKLAGSSIASLGVFAADAFLVPKAISSLASLPGLLKAKGLGDQLGSAYANYNSDTFGQQKALDALRGQTVEALGAGARGDYSKLSDALSAVNKALADNATVYNQATFAANQHTASLRVNEAAAAARLKSWLDDKATRDAAIAQQAAGFDIFGDTPGAKLGGQAADRDATAASAAASATSARQTVARDEQRLSDLRKTGKATAQQLASAEFTLAQAKERAAAANTRAVTAQGKANTADHLAGGLTAKDLLSRERVNLGYSQGLAKDAGKLVAAGLSAPVLEQLQATEKQFPGTIHNLVGSLNKHLVAEMNADRAKIDAAQRKFFGMDEAATTRLIRLAKTQADRVMAAWAKELALKSVPLGPYAPGSPLDLQTRPHPTGPVAPNSPLALQTRPHSAGPVSNVNYTFTGPIVANNTAQIIAEANRLKRIRALAGRP